jgi:hypothetical protein
LTVTSSLFSLAVAFEPKAFENEGVEGSTSSGDRLLLEEGGEEGEEVGGVK